MGALWDITLFVSGLLLMFAGVMLTLTIIGAVIGIPLIIAGVFCWKDINKAEVKQDGKRRK